MRKFGVAVIAFLAFCGAAAAAGYFPGFPSANLPLSGTELIPADTGLPNGQVPATVGVNSAQFGNKLVLQSAPLTGATQTLTSPLSTIVDLNPAGTIAAYTLTFPSCVTGTGQTVEIFSSQTITALTLTGTITGGVTTLAANGSAGYACSAGTWYRYR